jgi:hypothetical protein
LLSVVTAAGAPMIFSGWRSATMCTIDSELHT